MCIYGSIWLKPHLDIKLLFSHYKVMFPHDNKMNVEYFFRNSYRCNFMYKKGDIHKHFLKRLFTKLLLLYNSFTRNTTNQTPSLFT